MKAKWRGNWDNSTNFKIIITWITILNLKTATNKHIHKLFIYSLVHSTYSTCTYMVEERDWVVDGDVGIWMCEREGKLR